MMALCSNPRLLSTVRGAVEPLAETLGFPAAQRRSITRAVDEALTNIVRHSASRSNKGSRFFSATVAPQSMATNYAAGLSRNCDPAASACISSTRQWTRLSLPGRVLRTGCGSSSIWPRSGKTSEGENTVQISARRNDKTTIFDLSGDIDFANSPEVRQSVLREIRENRVARVVVNLSSVHYIDSSGVASLVEGLKASRDLGSRFILFGLSTAAREVLQLSRLLKVFEIYDSEEEALAR